MLKKITAIAMIAILAFSLVACNTAANTDTSSSQTVTASQSSQSSQASSSGTTAENAAKSDSSQDTVLTNANVTSTGKIDATDLFSKRDLTQTADLSNAETITLSDGQNVSITKEGVYVISGSAKNVTITVEAADDAKVQLVLDGVSVTNTDTPVIYVKNADKVFVTTLGDNNLSVTGSFTADGSTNTDAVIFSKDDLVLNGTGTLTISSTDNGISCKDDIKITGGTITIDCKQKGRSARGGQRRQHQGFNLYLRRHIYHQRIRRRDPRGNRSTDRRRRLRPHCGGMYRSDLRPDQRRHCQHFLLR